MLVVFVGAIFKDIQGRYYANAATNYKLTHYLEVADDVTVYARIKELDPLPNGLFALSSFNPEKLHLIEGAELMSIKGFFANRHFANMTIKKLVEDTDCVCLHMPSVVSSIAAKAARKCGKPDLIRLIGCPWDSLWNHSLKGKLIAPYIFILTRNNVKKASYVHYVTSQFLQKRYPTHGKYVGFSNVVLPKTDEFVLENRLQRIHTDPQEIVIGTAAAVNVRYKGQQYIIEALGRLKKMGITRYKYQLAGGGDQTYLRKVARENNVTEQVEFLGSLPHDRIFEWLDSIDIYAQPSESEGLPRSLIEAMCRGLPSIGTIAGGIPELLDDKFLFSNTRRNIHEICGILMRFDKESMLGQARRNFIEAKKYDRSFLEVRRNAFFQEFKENVERHHRLFAASGGDQK